MAERRQTGGKSGKSGTRSGTPPAEPSDVPYLAPTPEGGLLWGPLTRGTLLQRYKRFLADVRLADGTVVTAHTANTGTMLGCSEPGRAVWLSFHDIPTRKLKYTLEMIDMPTALVGVNTGVPNRLVKTAVLAGAVPELPVPATAKPEVRCGASRLDLQLRYESGPDTLIEIKNCSLAVDGAACFPDAVTARGARHLEELAALAGEGRRAVIFIVAQRRDVTRFSPADHIDPEWGRTLRKVLREGVELLAYRADIDTRGVAIGVRLPVVL